MNLNKTFIDSEWRRFEYNRDAFNSAESVDGREDALYYMVFALAAMLRHIERKLGENNENN